MSQVGLTASQPVALGEQRTGAQPEFASAKFWYLQGNDLKIDPKSS